MAALVSGGRRVGRSLGEGDLPLPHALRISLGVSGFALAGDHDVGGLALERPLIGAERRNLAARVGSVDLLRQLERGNADRDLVVLDFARGGHAGWLLVVASVVVRDAHAHVAVGMRARLAVDASHGARDVVRHLPGQLCLARRAGDLAALFLGIERAVVVPVNPSSDLADAGAFDRFRMGVAGERSDSAVPLGRVDSVFVVEQAVFVVALGVVAELLVALGVDVFAEAGGALPHRHLRLRAQGEKIGVAGLGNLSALPRRLEGRSGVAVGFRRVAEVCGDDESERDGGVAGALQGDRRLGHAFHEHDRVRPAQAVGPGVGAVGPSRAPLVDAFLVGGHEPQRLAGVRHLGVGRHQLAGGLRDARLRTQRVKHAPADVLVGAGLDPFVGPLVRGPALDPVPPGRGFGVGEDEALNRHLLDRAFPGVQLDLAGVVDAHAGRVAGGLGARAGGSPLFAVPGVRPVVGVSVGQADGHLVFVDVVGGIGQPVVPLGAAVFPLARAADVVEVVEGVAGPRAGNRRDEGAFGLLVGDVARMPEVPVIRQLAGGDELAGVAQVAFVDEVLRLPVVEHGDVGGRVVLKLRVIRPLEPLDRIDVSARAAGCEDRRKDRPLLDDVRLGLPGAALRKDRVENQRKAASHCGERMQLFTA